jgi:copper resistance protein B
MRFALLASLLLPAAATAQPMDHGSMTHSGMDHSSMDHSSMDHSSMEHGAGHDHAAPAPADVAEPPAPADRAADRLFGAGAMASSRAVLQAEHGAGTWASARLNLAEAQFHEGRQSYRWEGEGWWGGDLERLALRTQGEGGAGHGLERAELQALYWRALDPAFNLVAGLRGDARPRPGRAYAALGVEGVLPYWIELQATLFVSHRGDGLARLEAAQDLQLTRTLVLQPRVELDFAMQDVPALGTGAGLSEAELGLRLRYEGRRDLAPYVGLSWQRKVGATARLARADGESPGGGPRLVVGLHALY